MLTQSAAAIPLLATKLYIPKWRSGLVSRPKLVARLDQGTDRKLTLISAPAGFGKTTLLAEWLATAPTTERAAAWVSLDQNDNDPALFWTYVITALQKACPELDPRAGLTLESPQPPPIASVLTTLINDIDALGRDVTLILDDIHVIDAPPIHEAIAFLLDHLPPRMHLAIASRSDPPLPLARLRGRGESTELRASDLRFTPAEAAVFLSQVMGLDLSARDVESLETRTEGWIAGLQLAALSMRGRDDVAGFIHAFAGDDRYIVDYLVDEVLRRQPDDTRTFLLQTSMLNRLSGPLCDAVTGRKDSKAVVETLERENVFVVPLDDRRQWFRYHHLFADVLRAHLLDEHPDQAPELHRRASTWHVKHGDRSEAIRHALAASDFSSAADLVELALPAMRRSRQEARLLGWLRALPDDLIRCRPVLSVDYAGLSLMSGEIEGVEDRLRDAERWLDPPANAGEPAQSAGMVVVDDEEFRRLPGLIDLYRAGQALVRGDVAGTMRHAGQALDRFAADDDFGRGAAAGLLGLASWTSGDLVAGHRMYAECMSRLRRAGFIADTFGCALALADIRIAQGRLHEAMSTYERTLQLATERGAPVLRGTADMYVGMSELHRERGDLDLANQHLLKSKDLGDDIGLPQNPYRWCVALAHLREAQGDLDGALDLLLDAERLYVGDFFPNVRPVPAMKIRLWIAQGRLGEALGWVREQGLSAADDLSYVREFEHLTLARVLIAQYTNDQDNRAIHEAIGLLDRLLAAAEAGERAGSVIQILVLQALSHEAQGDIPKAVRALERALLLGEPEGYVRTFVDEGAPMARLLSHASTQRTAPRYTRRLLEAFRPVAPSSERSPSQPSATPTRALADPLSERELEVLRLVAEGLSNREISERLFLALDTVKGHNRRIFAKLGVQRRTEALSRARELELL